MGKKTNWTQVEDQSLCRAWIRASDGVLASGNEQKAAAFWNLVHAIYHKELESGTERPLNGLKIRWTRINRDVQQFALCFAHVSQQHAAMQATTNGNANHTGDGSNSSEPGTATSPPTTTTTSTTTTAAAAATSSSGLADLETEPSTHLIEQANLLYLADHPTKFAFETCWRMLRTCPKWIQLLRNANNTAFAISASSNSTPTSSSSVTNAAVSAVAAAAAAAAAAVANAPMISPSSSLLGEDMLPKEETSSNGGTAFLVSPSSTSSIVPMHVHGAAEDASSATEPNASPAAASVTASAPTTFSTKRKASAMSCSSSSSSTSQLALLKTDLDSINHSIRSLTQLTGSLVAEMQRHNELLEEQNAVSLFMTPKDAVEWVDASDLLQMLRQKYLKRIRLQVQQDL